MLIPPGRSLLARRAVNESVHRSMNERRNGEATIFGVATLRCECECFRAECASNFVIPINEYNGVREHGNRFVVVPGHEDPEEHFVVALEGCIVIEKSGEGGLIAESLARN